MHLFLWMYSLGLHAIFPLAVLWFWVRTRRTGKPFPPLRERLGWSLPIVSPVNGALRIWIHAVSVGEVLVVTPLIREIHRRYPGTFVALSTVTATGYATANKTLAQAATIFYCPLDFFWAVNRVLNRLQPTHLVIAETELWPFLFRQSHRRGVPVTIVNGRISNRAWPQYRRLSRFMRTFLHIPEQVMVQSEEDGRRFSALGVPPERIRVTGNMKFDTLTTIQPNDALADGIRKGMEAWNSKFWICGSTMPGEEVVIARAFRQLRSQHPDVRLIVAPRHPERFGDVAMLMSEEGLKTLRRSELSDELGQGRYDCLVLDTIGELASLYHMASAVFVGGSLVPHGGHNILEPAAAGVPILVGVHMENFQEIYDMFAAADAVATVANDADLCRSLNVVLTGGPRVESMIAAAKGLLMRHQGATQRNIDVILGHQHKGAS